jgi:hypothetical protein
VSDITVVNSNTEGRRASGEQHSADVASVAKIQKYAKNVTLQGATFLPAGIESYGGLSKSFLVLIKRLVDAVCPRASRFVKARKKQELIASIEVEINKRQTRQFDVFSSTFKDFTRWVQGVQIGGKKMGGIYPSVGDGGFGGYPNYLYWSNITGKSPQTYIQCFLHRNYNSGVSNMILHRCAVEHKGVSIESGLPNLVPPSFPHPRMYPHNLTGYFSTIIASSIRKALYLGFSDVSHSSGNKYIHLTSP